jgi:hypothetical protein
MGANESSEQRGEWKESETVRVELVWERRRSSATAPATTDPDAKSGNSVSFTLTLKREQVESGPFWPVLRSKLVEEGLLADANARVDWTLDNVLVRLIATGMATSPHFSPMAIGPLGKDEERHGLEDYMLGNRERIRVLASEHKA